jgi:hypothetical protein
MQELIYYMYSGRSTNLAAMAAEILAAADRFALVPLKEMADQMMRTQLHKDSVCRDLILADLHDAQPLKRECIQFISRNAQAVIQVCVCSCVRMDVCADGWLARVGRAQPDQRSGTGHRREGWCGRASCCRRAATTVTAVEQFSEFE